MEEGASKSERLGVRDATTSSGWGLERESYAAPDSFAPRCLSIDLEVGRDDARIHRFAAVRGDTGQAFHFRGGDLPAALVKLDQLADGVAFLLGHNLIDFDVKHLAAALPSLGLLQLPRIDTLWLNPLAFPRNPYHHLVKGRHTNIAGRYVVCGFQPDDSR